jgi:putative ABC transport system permease protein
MILRMAWRNLRRRPVQSALAAGAVAVGLAVCVFLANFQYGSWANMLHDLVRSTAGHVVVQHPRFQETRDSKYLVEHSGDVAREVAAVDPSGTVLRRVLHPGLVASANNTVAVELAGVEPAKEKAVSPMVDKIVEGGWFEAEDEAFILVGVELAKRLQVGVGDKVVVTTSSAGELQARPVRVRGIFQTHNVRTDAFFAVLTFAETQALLPTFDDPATHVALLRDELEVPAGLADRVRAAVPADLAVLEWDEALPEARKSEQLDKAMGDVIWLFLGAIATIGILNVLLMSLFQRTRELGVMLAVGMRPLDVARLLLAEGMLLGFVGVFAGLLLGWAVTWPAKVYGLSLVELQNQAPVANAAVDTVMHAQYMWQRDLSMAVVFVALSALSSLWPAIRAARLEPVDSLRSV